MNKYWMPMRRSIAAVEELIGAVAAAGRQYRHCQ